MAEPIVRRSAHLTDLVTRAQHGDRAALESVLQQLAPSIHRFGSRMCRHAQDAEDVVQETLFQVAQHLKDFHGEASLTSWAFTLTRSACVRKRRGLKNQPHAGDEALIEAHDAAPSPESRAEAYELREVLAHALDALSLEHREIILLRDVEGLSAPEVAQILSLSVDAVKSRLHRAREGLKAAFLPRMEGRGVRDARCPDVVALWSQKLEGELNALDCASMEQHVLDCAHCGAACEALKHALHACQRSRTDEVSPGVQARVKAALQAWAGPS